MGPHTIKIVNDGSIDPAHGDWSWFDVDYVTFDAEVANAAQGAPDEAQIFDDTHPAFKYLPDASAWSTYGNSQGASNSTITTTTNLKGVVEFSFSGDAVALYGPLDPKNGQYVVSIDGRNQPAAWANYTSTVPGSTLFVATQLGVGSHVLTVTNYPSSGSQASLSIDYARVWGTPAQTTSKKKSNIGPIIGGAIGGVLFLGLLISLFFFLRRRRQSHKRGPVRDILSDPGEMIEVPVEASTISPYTDDGPYYARHIGSQSNISDPRSTTYTGNETSVTSSNSTSALLVHNYPNNHGAAQSSFVSSGSSVPPIPADALAYLQKERQRSGKSAQTIVPPMQRSEAQYQMAARDPEVLRQERMVVEGRPQDFGPVRQSGQYNVDLPPDYGQAVEPPTHR